MRRRKLLNKLMLDDIQRLLDIGVPLAKIIREAELEMSQPSVTKLLKWYKQSQLPTGETACIITLSLFPKWLAYEQEQPEGVEYKGYFPLGEWEE